MNRGMTEENRNGGDPTLDDIPPEELSELNNIISSVLQITAEDSDDVFFQIQTLLSHGLKLQTNAAEFEPHVILKNDHLRQSLTDEEMKKASLWDELVNFYSVAGGLLERFTTELIVEEVVADDRESNSVRSDIEKMPQRKREWLLHISGEIDDGTKSEVRRVYQLRNDLLHGPAQYALLEKMGSIESEVDRAINAIDDLHKLIFGESIFQRAYSDYDFSALK